LTYHLSCEIIGNVIFVLDTNVIVAAMRSPTGASAALLMAARRGDIAIAANVALAVEYEATCTRAEHVLASGLSAHQVGIFLDAVVAMVEPIDSHFLWRPMLRNPADELVLEAAVNGRAAAIVTFNQRDFGAVPLQFGVEVLTPIDALRRIKP
jgi:putative PIN family toxin of toxin-antitoxin system